jgi:hypothetical protein
MCKYSLAVLIPFLIAASFTTAGCGGSHKSKPKVHKGFVGTWANTFGEQTRYYADNTGCFPEVYTFQLINANDALELDGVRDNTSYVRKGGTFGISLFGEWVQVDIPLVTLSIFDNGDFKDDQGYCYYFCRGTYTSTSTTITLSHPFTYSYNSSHITTVSRFWMYYTLDNDTLSFEGDYMDRISGNSGELDGIYRVDDSPGQYRIVEISGGNIKYDCYSNYAIYWSASGPYTDDGDYLIWDMGVTYRYEFVDDDTLTYYDIGGAIWSDHRLD